MCVRSHNVTGVYGWGVRVGRWQKRTDRRACYIFGHINCRVLKDNPRPQEICCPINLSAQRTRTQPKRSHRPLNRGRDKEEASIKRNCPNTPALSAFRRNNSWNNLPAVSQHFPFTPLSKHNHEFLWAFSSTPPFPPDCLSINPLCGSQNDLHPTS